MLFNIDKLCQGDVFIHGRILTLIENDLWYSANNICRCVGPRNVTL
jgi:hypothetical protein